MKKLTQLLTQPSCKFLADFINDTADKKAQEQLLNDILLQLKKAALQKSLVVLQVEDAKQQKIETITGWLATRNIKKESIVIRTQETKELKLVPIERIKKVSIRQMRENEVGMVDLT